VKLSVSSRIAPLDSGIDFSDFASPSLDDEEVIPSERPTEPRSSSVDFGQLRALTSEVRVRCAARVMVIRERGRKWESE
jgi:hypothetical protein